MKDPRRDIELVLLGVILAKDSPARERVLDGLPGGSMTGDIEKAFHAVRRQEPDGMIEWLSAHGCQMEKGKDVIQSLIDVIADDNRHQRIKDVCRSLGFASRLESVDELKERLQRAMETLENL